MLQVLVEYMLEPLRQYLNPPSGQLKFTRCYETEQKLSTSDVLLLQVLVEYAGQSFRLLALAVGTLSNVSAAELAGMDQQQAEACCGPLDLLGLQVLSNHLRPSSRQTVTNLKDRCAAQYCAVPRCVVQCCDVPR